MTSIDSLKRFLKKENRFPRKTKQKERQLWGSKNVDEIFMSGILFFVNKKENISLRDSYTQKRQGAETVGTRTHQWRLCPHIHREPANENTHNDASHESNAHKVAAINRSKIDVVVRQLKLFTQFRELTIH